MIELKTIDRILGMKLLEYHRSLYETDRTSARIEVN